MTTANSHRFVPKSHKEFAKDALEQLKRVNDVELMYMYLQRSLQLRGESGGDGHVTEVKL